MPYNEALAERMRQILYQKEALFYEKKMFSGLCFMVDDKMCCTTHTDKRTGEDVMLCRIGEDAYEVALNMEYCTPMNFTGKPMKGYVYVTENGLRSFKELSYWLQLCLDYNPIAKRSGKKS